MGGGTSSGVIADPKVDSLYAQLFGDPEVIQTVGSRETALALIKRLVRDFEERDSLDYAGMLRRTCHPKFGTELLVEAGEYFRGNLDDDFAVAVASMPQAWWMEYFDSVKIGRWLSEWANFRKLFHRVRAVAIDKTHPLHNEVRPDTYWKDQIKYLLLGGQIAAAFSELKHAMKGLPLKQHATYAEQTKHLFYWQASVRLVKTLVVEAYSCLHQCGEVPAYPGGIEGYVHMKYRHVHDNYWRPIPGFDLASQYFVVKAGGGREFKQTPYVFTTEGGMFLAMAKHFADR